MSMTREEAIVVLAESKRQNEVMRDNPSTFWASHQMADGVKNAERRIAALDIALSALRPVGGEQVDVVINSLKLRLENNEEGGVVYIPKFAVRGMIERLEAIENG